MSTRAQLVQNHTKRPSVKSWCASKFIIKLVLAGLVHYDLKLRNILVKSDKKDKHKVNEDTTLMLCDLDSSCPINSLRSVNDKKGSSAYYAPEVARWNIASTMSSNDEETRPVQLVHVLRDLL